MLRSRLISSINSTGILSTLLIDNPFRLFVAKDSGDIEVYVIANDITGMSGSLHPLNSSNSLTESVFRPFQFELSQIYSNLLKNLSNASNTDLDIQDMLYSEQLNTIFIKCKSMVVLLNSANLQIYDKVCDKRGIKQVWVKTYVKELRDSSKTKTFGYKSNSNKNENINSSVNNDSITYLVYSTTKASTLRVLFWKGRT